MVNENQVFHTLVDQNVIGLSKTAKTLGRHLKKMLKTKEPEVNRPSRHFAEPKCLSFLKSEIQSKQKM